MELTTEQVEKLEKIGCNPHLFLIEGNLIDVQGLANWLSDNEKVDCVAMPNYNAKGRIYFGLVACYFQNEFRFQYLQDKKYEKSFHGMGMMANEIFYNREDALSACVSYGLDLVIEQKNKNGQQTT